MLSATLLLTSALVGFATAQQSSNFTIPTDVDGPTKNAWCLSERNACPLLCGGKANMKSNICLADDIDNFECTCLPDGDTPDKIEQYVGTVPNSACLAQFKDCRLKNPGSKNCPVCGTLQPSDVAAVVPSSTAASSSASSTSSPSVTAASTTPSASSTGAAVRMGAEVGGVAVGLAAALGMLL